jgi:hypothetical protein
MWILSPKKYQWFIKSLKLLGVTNLKKGKGKAYNVTLSDESEEEALEFEKFLAFVAPHVEEEDSYYSEHSDNGEELKEACKTLYIEYEKLRGSKAAPLWSKQFADWEEFIAAQNTRARGKATRDTARTRKSHWWEADLYAVYPEEPNWQDWSRVCSSLFWCPFYFKNCICETYSPRASSHCWR